MTRQDSKPGDHVDLLALIDVLAVPNVCGSDVMRTSNFALRPLQLSIYQATDAEIASVPKVPTLKSQRTPKDFVNAKIKSDRPLRRDPAYVAQFANAPIRITDLPVALTAQEMELLRRLRLDIYGDDDASALRDIFFTWWEERFLAANSGAPAIDESAAVSD